MTRNAKEHDLTGRDAAHWKGLGLALLATPLPLLVGLWFYFGWPLVHTPFGAIVGVWCWGFGITVLALLSANFRKSRWPNTVNAGLVAALIIGLVWIGSSTAANQLGLTPPYFPMFGGER